MSEVVLDIENHDALGRYLRARDPDLKPIQMQTLAGGVSNRTVLVRFADGKAWVIKQALAKLRTKADWFSDPARVHREALGMRWLAKLAPPGTIPEFVFEDFEHHLLAMAAVPEPHENWKEMLLRGDVELEHFQQFGQLLAAIHRNGASSAGDPATVFGDRSFFESLRLEPYYLYAAQQLPEAAEFLHQLVDETRKRRLTIVHGDFSPKNILVREAKLVLLDHEVIHWGDPTFDVGFAMAHFLSKMRHLAAYRPALSRATGSFHASYLSEAPFADEQQIIRHTLACLLARVAGRSPLEYLSYEEKQSQQRRVLRLTKKVPRDITSVTAAMATL